jgi:hypothetical protein
MAQYDADNEFELFHQLAEAIGETLEAVYNMQESERGELIIALGLMKGGNKDIGENITTEMNKGQVVNAKDIVETFKDDDGDNLVLDKVQFAFESDNIDTFDEETRLDNDTVVKEDDANNINRQNQESLLELDGVHPKLISLQKDADLVIKLLGPGRDGVINAELVLAYLEAHMDRPERVQVVVEELAGIDNDDSQTPERQLSVEMIKSKKGKRKSSKSCQPC